MVVNCSRQSLSEVPTEFPELLMADWLHCNLCFLQPGDGTPFHITSCGHIYCNSCVGKGSKASCSMCASKCSTLELSGKMKPDVESFFLDPLDMLNKALKKVLQTWEFQRNHRRRLFSHMSAKVQELNKVVMEATKVVSRVQSLDKELVKLREENIYLKKLLQEKAFATSTFFTNRIQKCQTTSNVLSSQLTSNITPGRLIARTPPSGGRMGTVGGGSSTTISLHRTQQSVAHNMLIPALRSDSPMTD